jgi:hypothetical protein
VDAYCAAVCWHSLPVLAKLGTGSKDVKRDWTAARPRVGGEGNSANNPKTPPFLLIEAVIKEGNHVDESVCHLQNISFQSSLGREGAVPVWVGMGYLATMSGEVPNPKGTLPDTR